jgi:hypothetical protein
MARRTAMRGLATAICALWVTSVSAASTWYVDTTGDDSNDCTTAGTACLTLQGAIGKSSDGDTIEVAAGTYAVNGLVSVNRQLTLRGAQAGVDARSRAASESILENTQGISVSASGVTIDGFTIQGSVIAAFTGYGVWLNPTVDGTTVVNNIFQDNIVGLGLSNLGTTQALVQYNAFLHNNQPGGASGTGIYTDQFVSGAVKNVLIDANDFIDNDNAGIGFSNSDTSIPGADIEVSNNSLDENGRGMYFYNTDNVSIHDNTITNTTVPTDGGTSVGIAAFGDVDGMTILNNDILDGVLRGIRVGNFLENPNSDIVAHYNNIVGNVYAGLEVHANGHTGPVDATCNWWGSATGPTNPTANPAATLRSNPGSRAKLPTDRARAAAWAKSNRPARPARCMSLAPCLRLGRSGTRQGDRPSMR